MNTGTPTREELLNALRLYEDAFSDLFGQCCSNPVKDAWGREVNMAKFNEAHRVSDALLSREPSIEVSYSRRASLTKSTEACVTPQPAPHKRPPAKKVSA